MTETTVQTQAGGTTPLRRMNSNLPNNKVTVTALAVAIAQFILWRYSVSGGEPIPVEVSGAILTVITFVVGYLVPPGRNEEVVQVARVP